VEPLAAIPPASLWRRAVTCITGLSNGGSEGRCGARALGDAGAHVDMMRHLITGK